MECYVTSGSAGPPQPAPATGNRLSKGDSDAAVRGLTQDIHVCIVQDPRQQAEFADSPQQKKHPRCPTGRAASGASGGLQGRTRRTRTEVTTSSRMLTRNGCLFAVRDMVVSAHCTQTRRDIFDTSRTPTLEDNLVPVVHNAYPCRLGTQTYRISPSAMSHYRVAPL